MKSIRGRLTLGLALGCTATFVLAGAVLHTVVADTLQRQFDATLEQRARTLWTTIDYHGHDRFEFELDEEATPEYVGGPDAQYFHVWDGHGRELARSTSLGEGGLPQRLGLDEHAVGWDLALIDGRPGRALGLRLPVRLEEELDPATLDDFPELVIVVARSREPLLAELSALQTGLAAAGVAALLLIVWLVALSVRHGLAPLQRLREEVERVDAASLSTRLDSAHVPDELAPVVRTLNELFARLETSFARQRRMTGAIAHELRTPIAELRMATDVSRLWPDDALLREQAASTAHDVAVRMSELVEAVMRYCRMETGQTRLELGVLDPAALADELWAPHAGRARERGLTFSNAIPPGRELASDRGLLAIALGNLFSNAASHATPDGDGGIALALRTHHDGSVALDLSSPCDSLGPDDLAHLTEPFWQADGARHDGRHSGLGLTLTEAVVQALGGRLLLHLRAGRFVAEVLLPRQPAVSAPADPSPAHHPRPAKHG